MAPRTELNIHSNKSPLGQQLQQNTAKDEEGEEMENEIMCIVGWLSS